VIIFIPNEIQLKKLIFLKEIDLKYNKIEVIRKNTFYEFFNEIGCVFRRLKNINEIQLNNNLISEFNENAFDGLFELKRIELNNNYSNGHYYLKLQDNAEEFIINDRNEIENIRKKSKDY